MVKYPYSIENDICSFLMKLQNPETGAWPPTSPSERIESVWTTAVVLRCLNQVNAPVKFPQKCIDFIMVNERSEDGCWTELKFKKPILCVLTTSEVIRAMLQLYQIKSIKEPLQILQNMQNDDNGWGITVKTGSRIRTTLYALRALLECNACEELSLILDKNKIQKGIFYILRAINNKGGLGKIPGSRSIDVSCTALGIIVLIRAKKEGFEVKDYKIEAMVETLINKRSGETWFPSHEEINVDGTPIPIGDCGTPLVLLAFSMAVESLQYPRSLLPFPTIINEIVDCTREGAYYCPGIDDVRVWETAELLNALQYYKKIVLASKGNEYNNYEKKIFPYSKGEYFVQIENLSEKNLLLKKILNKKKGLSEGLQLTRIRNNEWPAYYLHDKHSEIWTSAEIMNVLLACGINPDGYDIILENITDNSIEKNGYIGWETPRLGNKISIYVTTQVGLLYLFARNFDLVKGIIETIQDFQHREGGWGVCEGDKENRVRPTTYALEFLLRCLDYDALKTKIETNCIEKGVAWLEKAQNYKENDKGWGDLRNSYPSNVTATSRALLILFLAHEKEFKIEEFENSVRNGLKTFKELCEEKSWTGQMENCEIFFENESKIHEVGGSGAAFALQTLCSAISNGYMSPSDEAFLSCLTNLLKRIQEYKNYQGLWVVPSDLGTMPIIWNSAHALKGLKMVEDMWIEYISGAFLERPIFESVAKREKHWKYVAIIILMGIGIYATFLFNLPGIIINWFSQLSDLGKALLGGCILLIFQRILKWLQSIEELNSIKELKIIRKILRIEKTPTEA